MIDAKRKKIYYAVIIAAVLVAVVILIINRQSSPEIDLTVSPGQTPNATGGTAPAGGAVFQAPPAVFPIDKDFDISVLDSSSFRMLKPYTLLQVLDSELGRDDPFHSF